MQKLMGKWSAFFAMGLTLVSLLACPSVARPPASDIRGVYENTRDDRKEYSPLWGMIAIEGELLKGTRFYGNYSILSRDPSIRQNQFNWAHPAVKIQYTRLKENLSKIGNNLEYQKTLKTLESLDDFPNGAIEGWLQALFPSPHFLELSPNMRRHDHLGNLMREPGLSTLNGLIELMVVFRKGGISKDDFKNQTITLFNMFGNQLSKYSPWNRSKISSGQIPRFQEESSRLAGLIADAIEEEKIKANPQNPSQQVYPNNIVMTALLAFIWERIDSSEQLFQLNSLMKARTTTDTSPPWDKSDYEDFSKNLSNNINNIEKLAFMLSSYDTYDKLVPTFMTHRTIEPDNGPSFYNCGENSLMQFFWVMLSKEGSFKQEFLDGLFANLPNTQPTQKQLDFINFWKTDFNNWNQVGLYKTHKKWTEIVSDMNSPQDPMPIGYNQSTGRHEIVYGIYNMLTVMAHLLPDPILNEPWSSNAVEIETQAVEKLNRLCEILSRPDFEVSWSMDNKKPKEIPQEGAITFSINGDTAFIWDLGMGHWELQNVRNQTSGSWKSKVNLENSQNEWINTRFMDTSKSDNIIFNLYNPDNRTVNGAFWFARTLLDLPDPSPYYAAIGRTLKKSIPLDDPGPRNTLLNLMRLFHQNPFFLTYWPKIIHPDDDKALKTEVLLKLYTPEFPEEQVIQFIQHNNVDPTNEKLINRIVSYGHIRVATALVSHGGSFHGTPPFQTIPLLVASQYNRLPFVQYLYGALKVDLNQPDSQGDTALHYASLLNHKETMGYLLQNGALPSINAQNSDGDTPLHLAAKSNPENTDLVFMLLGNGANMQLQNKEGKTPLQIAAESGKLEFIRDVLAYQASYRKINPQVVIQGLPSVKFDLRKYSAQDIYTLLAIPDTANFIREVTFVGGKIEDILGICSKLPQLKSLVISENNVDDAGATAIATNMAHLTSLNLEGNKIGATGAIVIATNMAHLTSLNLAGNNIDDAGAIVIATNMALLTSLNLEGNKIGAVGATAIATNMRNLTFLNLRGNNIGPEGVKAIVNSPNMRNLTSLNLGGNRIGPEGVKDIVNSPNMRNLTSLNLGGNRIGAAEVKYIVNSPNMRNLISLDLENNNIGPEGVKAIVNSPNMRNLTSLDLENNNIGAEGAKDIANSTNMRNLTSLNLYKNDIEQEGCKDIVNSPNMRNLTSLNLGENLISITGATAIANSPNMARLTSLNLEANTIGTTGATAIATSPNMARLTSLNLSSNSIGEEGGKDIANSPNMARLTSLNLRGNNIGDAMKSLLKERFGSRVAF